MLMRYSGPLPVGERCAWNRVSPRTWHSSASQKSRPIVRGQGRTQQRPCATYRVGSPKTALVPTMVYEAIFLDPRHHVAQFLAHDLDLLLRADAAHRLQHRCARAMLQDELAGELTRLDL